MGTQTIDISAHTSGSPTEVFAVLADAASWPDWSPIGAYEEERPSPTEPNGVGTIRRFTTGRITSREEVVVFEPGRRFAYVLLSGLPLRGYRAEVTLEPSPAGGTDMRWRSTFRPRVPGTGGLYRRPLARFLADTVDALVAVTSRAEPATPGDGVATAELGHEAPA